MKSQVKSQAVNEYLNDGNLVKSLLFRWPDLVHRKWIKSSTLNQECELEAAAFQNWNLFPSSFLRFFCQGSLKCPGARDNEPGGSRMPGSRAGKHGSKEAIDEVSISTPPQWEPTAVAKRINTTNYYNFHNLHWTFRGVRTRAPLPLACISAVKYRTPEES